MVSAVDCPARRLAGHAACHAKLWGISLGKLRVVGQAVSGGLEGEEGDIFVVWRRNALMASTDRRQVSNC